MFAIRTMILIGLCLLAWVRPGPALAGEIGWQDQIRRLAPNGAVVLARPDGGVHFALNPDKPLNPASILKVFTAAAAFATLGPDYRFSTDFHLSSDGDLYVVGRGDPYLVSEELEAIAVRLKDLGLRRVNHLYLDNSYFPDGLVLDGTERTLNPYDAYNGALCVNFNTVYAEVRSGGQVVTAEPQTPLTDLARDMALKTRRQGKMRFNLSDRPETCLLYAGELMRAFLEQAGIPVQNGLASRRVDAGTAPLFYRRRSSKDLPWLVALIFKYSNNFMANQLFLTMGAERFGPPATPEKARKVMAGYLQSLGLRPPPYLEEGSGLSRRTRITAAQMIAVLRDFAPHRDLLTEQDPAWFKTGTLNDVKSLAGYLVARDNRELPFVVLLNGSGYTGRTRDRILHLLETELTQGSR
ncbi:MAG: D-alanyl-D-alanine carboxypeptidase [Proteobacteria bacterium]|nr:D-alanyl-D-alanine carboxypeptidase [Pseudomonadota bacterium]